MKIENLFSYLFPPIEELVLRDLVTQELKFSMHTNLRVYLILQHVYCNNVAVCITDHEQNLTTCTISVVLLSLQNQDTLPNR